MTTRALLIVHDAHPARRDRIPGGLLPALSTRDIKHDVLSFAGDGEPVPGDARDYDLVVVLGSSESAYDDTVPWLADEIAFVSAAVERGLPVLGICFGGQLLARIAGGTVGRARRPEIGFTTVDSADPELIPPGPWMQFHGDAFVPPAGTEIARNASGSQAFTLGKVLGVQFHPEITVDSFDSWSVHRHTGRGGPDLAALRAEIAAEEDRCVRLCDGLVGTFCARYVG
jgi:GMP synthase-like glutamine amidotransferase